MLAHRTTGGDLGNYLMAGLPNASYLGFTGTPTVKTAYGRGTFKTFGGEDDKGYLYEHSIAFTIAEATWSTLYSTGIRPFDKPTIGKIAVKVINHSGDEVMKVFGV